MEYSVEGGNEEIVARRMQRNARDVALVCTQDMRVLRILDAPNTCRAIGRTGQHELLSRMVLHTSNLLGVSCNTLRNDE